MLERKIYRCAVALLGPSLATLEVAMARPNALFSPERTDLVCFGLFRDAERAGGELAGFVASEPARPLAHASRFCF